MPIMYDIYSSPLIKFSVKVNEGVLECEARGILSPLAEKYASILNGKRIIGMNKSEVYISSWIPPLPSRAFSRLVKCYVKGLMMRYVPEMLTLCITEECPNRCVHCAIPTSGRGLKLSVKDASSIISQALDLGTTTIAFDGGEPMIYEELPELVRCVDDRAIATLFTSGYGATHEWLKELKDAGLYSIHVSLDSPFKEEHDKMRGREGVFEEAREAIKNALKVGLLCDIYVVLSRDNVQSLWEFYELARKWGAHELSFYELVPTGRYLARLDKTLRAEDYKSIKEFVSESSEQGRPNVFSIVGEIETLGCFAGRKWLHVDVDGSVRPCACIPLSYGNAKSESLKKIWKRIRRDPVYNARSCLMKNPFFRKEYLNLER